MTQANFDTNNNVDISSITLKFHMWMYDRIKNMYTQRGILFTCAFKPLTTTF